MSEEEPNGSKKNPRSRWSVIAERTLIDNDEEDKTSFDQPTPFYHRRSSQKLLEDIKQSKLFTVYFFNACLLQSIFKMLTIDINDMFKHYILPFVILKKKTDVNVEPELSIHLLKIPNAPNYSGLRKLIENANPKWLKEFLEKGGLSVLFDKLQMLSIVHRSSVSDALLLLNVTK